MDDEAGFNATLDANPDDWQTRLVYADWLQDRDDPRAEGYRALGVLRVVPFYYREPKEPAWLYWNIDRYGTPFPPRRDANEIDSAMLPGDWHALALEGKREGDAVIGFTSRREAEDAAAHAFAKLPASRREELLADESVTLA